MPIGPSSRPQEPLYVFRMALALVLAALAGGALGLVWQWLAGEETPDDQIEATMQVDPAAESEDGADEAEPPVAPPRPSPAPSPNAG